MTKQIELTQGKHTLVDSDKFDWLNQWKWYAIKRPNIYYAVRKDKRTDAQIFMHREVLGLTHNDEKTTDHKNRDGLDNRLSNLHVVSTSENARNHRLNSNNTSGFSGVYWLKTKNRWQVRIGINKKRIYLGSYSQIDDAIEARKQGELKHWN